MGKGNAIFGIENCTLAGKTPIATNITSAPSAGLGGLARCSRSHRRREAAVGEGGRAASLHSQHHHV